MHGVKYLDQLKGAEARRKQARWQLAQRTVGLFGKLSPREFDIFRKGFRAGSRRGYHAKFRMNAPLRKGVA